MTAHLSRVGHGRIPIVKRIRCNVGKFSIDITNVGVHLPGVTTYNKNIMACVVYTAAASYHADS